MVANISDENFDFNPRSRKGSDVYEQNKYHEAGISIHAPARGATAYVQGKQHDSGISIHAPARGATIPIISPSSFFSDFNPRSRKGSDKANNGFGASHRNFNPRSRKGSDSAV